jgi:hypothetical protein
MTQFVTSNANTLHQIQITKLLGSIFNRQLKNETNHINCFNFWVYPQRLIYIDRGFRNVGQYKSDAGDTPKN